MKRAIIPALVIAVAATAFYFRDTWLPPRPGQGNYLGYVEGETILIASPVAGRIVERRPEKGDTVAAGEVMFRLDGASQQAEVARLEAAVTTAEANLANQMSGKRDAELEITRAQRREAEAALTLAEQELARAESLTGSGVAAMARYDSAKSQVDQIKARIATVDATLAAGQLGGREPEIAAARSRVAEAKAAAEGARRKLADLSPEAPVAAAVDNVFYDAGEYVPAGQPVVSLLPPGNLKLRFFAPEDIVTHLAPGTAVTFHCDGCGEPRHAAVTFVATTPEYTPPVIYSQGARSKLVYLVEAKPQGSSAALRPGLPIEVEPLK